MKKALKITGLIVAALLALSVLGIWLAHTPRPEASPSPEADALARKMMEAVNAEAWEATRYVAWAFPGGHEYIWDKAKEVVQVKWGDTEVLMSANGPNGKAWRSEQPLGGEAAQQALEQAWGFFCNDAFWLCAPTKVFDPGTTRSLATLQDGSRGLLVAYSSGGVTPGDAYLWELGEDGRPLSYRMWVSVLPIGGLKASWEKWEQLPTGARLATAHDFGLISMELEGVRGGQSLQDVGLSFYPFEALGIRE
ncbi:DUF2059 domain-containing protein [Phaeodactylibacter luteus]|uniref:hypothetical protein n=1 Tax=Phaeodactylibacter luteus TaxID=1564516 RepID=UPI001478D0EA|nr:hypothetical protein [Phaeodactylibacter luteus]